MMRKLYLLFGLLGLSLALSAQNKPVKTITDASLVGATTYTWTKDTVYLLDGFVFLETGGILNIDPGTVIKAKNKPANGIDKTSALIITRGAQIFARGLEGSPIVFTAELDDVTDPGDLTSLDRGLWGGLVILGNGVIGEDGGEENIEGIPSTENKARYGGTAEADNSGVLRYVSIRHGGAELAPDNEINGLTLGGVGSGTIIDFIEVFANEDDGIELFGGNVDIKHAAVSFCGDDSYDYDESWGGRGQFWFSLQNAQTGDNAGEFDGSEKTDLTPKSFPTIYNATFIGAGASSGRSGNDGFDIRADAAVVFNNSIVTDFGGKGLRIRNQTASDSYARLTGGDTKFRNNLWFGFGAGATPELFIELYTNTAGGTLQTILDSIATKWNNQVVDPLLGGISRTNNAGLDPRPNPTSPALSGALAPTDNWFETTAYRGAFSNSNNWAENWTALDQYGFFGDLTQRTQEVITDGDIVADSTYTWTREKEYILDGYVFVEAGAKLTIEPGTVIKGRNKPTNGVDKSSALIITRGAQIFANGTEARPIIFTAEADNVNDPADLTSLDRGLWGGLVILGRAIIGEDGGEENIEGIPSTENKARYGGTDDADNSGVIRYVSIRHAGAEIAPDNEINGLTLGGVGSGTTIDFIEVFANEDDGIELFGGKVDIKHAVVSFCGDDSYDYDESWGGRGQFWFSIQNAQTGDNAGEFDGSEKTDLTPKNFPTIFNATFIGAGASSARSGNDGFDIRADAAVAFNNSIVTDFGGKGLRLRNQTASDSYSRLTGGDTKFLNNIWNGFGAGNTPDKFIELYTNNAGGTLQTILDSITKWNNQVVDPLLGGISRTNNAGLDPRPNQGSPALTGALAPADSWFTATTYRGAFSNSTNWAENWTALAQYGFFGDLATRDQEVITDADLVAGGTYTWTKDKEYILDGYVFLEEGGKLTIEPGTVVKGRNKPTNGVDKSSALIITRGAQIFANGTKALPIIFTAEADNVNDPADLTSLDRGLWGGLVILGRAIIGEDGGEENIEGIPSTENKARYGGANDADNSGILKYVSIRHAGAEIAPDNEINGLTLGGVGSGTTIDYIEVFANEDDGIELFGGKVDIKHAVVSFCGDDSYDYDESWGGRGQFWFSIQNAQTGDNAGEFDGSEKTDLTPKNFPTIFNATFIGAGASSGRTGNDGFDIRADAAVAFNNSIVTDFGGKGLRLRNQTASDSYARLTGGDTKFLNNIWFGFGAGNTPDKFIELYTNNAGGTLQTILDSITKWNNQVVDPLLGGISRTNNGGLDPRPNAGSPALSGALTPADNWFETTTYRGAFGLTNWADEWSALAQYGFFGKLATEVVELGENDRGLKLDVPTPNPASNFALVNFNLPAASMVNFRTFDLSGRMIDQANLGLFQKGENQFNLNVTKYQTGLYILAIKTEFGVVTQKFAVANAKN